MGEPANQPNADYGPTPPDPTVVNLARQVGQLEGSVSTLVTSIEDWRTDTASRFEEAEQKNSDEHREVAGLLKDSGLRLTRLENDTTAIRTAIDAKPGGLIDLEVRVRKIEDGRNVEAGKREWWRHPLFVGVLCLIVGAMLSVAVAFAKAQIDKTDALCKTKFQSLDVGRGRGSLTQHQYDSQLRTLVSQGCTRS